MTIGDFSRATRLSAKTLRFYHQAGLLLPASIDAHNSYRLYSPSQISVAQVIRQLRTMDVPVDVIYGILATPTVADRNQMISDHLVRMEQQLEQTRSAVASLRSLLQPPGAPIAISHRSVPACAGIVIRQNIDLVDLGDWYTSTMAELTAVAAVPGVKSVGPRGGIWGTELFLHEHGDAALYFPIDKLESNLPAGSRARVELLPAVDLAVATHHGTDDTVAEVYAALGEYVSVHELGIDGPIRETYLHLATEEGNESVTEIGWPIFRAAR